MSKPTYVELEKRVKELEKTQKAESTSDRDWSGSSENYLSLLENASNFITVVDKNHIIQYINHPVPGLEKEEVIGKSVYDFVSPEFHNIARGKIESVFSTGENTYYESQATGPKGTISWYETHLSLMKQNAEVIGVSLVATDITERKEVENALFNSEDKFRILYENAPLGYQSLDEKGNFISVNTAWLDTLGYTREEVLGHNFSEFIADDFREVFKENFPKFKKIGYILGVEFEMVKKDGTEILVSFNGKIGYDESGEFKQTHCILNDIAAQRAAEESLRKSETKYRALVETSSDIIWEVNQEGKFTYISPNVKDIWGYEQEEVIGKTPFDFVVAEELEQMLKIFQDESNLANPFHSYEYTYLHRDGRHIVIETSGTPAFDDKGNLQGYRGVNRDITKRKNAELALRDSEEKFRTLIETMNEGLVQLNADKEIVYVNDKFCDMLQYKKQELIGKPPFFIAEESADEVAEQLSKRKLGFEEKYDTVFVTKKQQRINVVVSPKVNYDQKGNFAGSFSVTSNITERKKMEDALEEISVRYTSLVDQSPVSYEIYDKEGIMVNANKAWEELWGGKKEDAVGKYNIRLDPQLKVLGLKKTIDRAFDGEALTIPDTHYDPRKSGSRGRPRWLNSMVYPIKDSSGEVMNVIITHEDITDRKNAEESLKENEMDYIRIQEAAHFGSWNLDLIKNKLVWSDENYRIFGMPEDRPGNTYEKFLEIVHPDDVEYVNKKWMAAVNDNAPYDIEHRLLIDGKVRWVREVAKVVHNEEGVAVKGVGITQDITVRKMLEQEREILKEQLLQSQKMESIGRLAGGIAHDFNNILTGIMGYAELLRMKHPDDSSDEGEAAEIIINGAERASDLTKQLLGFARGGKYNPVPLKINEVIKDTVRVSEKIFEKKITIKYNFEKKINTTDADKNQLDQILTNLIINAKDAMPLGGELSFRTENVYLDEEYVKIYPYFKPGSYVKLSVTDSGTGMPQDIKESIFEPFFTTKGEGKGTGLGLSTVYGIVKNHGGHINVYSEPGEGTTFTLYFPVSEKEIMDVVDVRQVYKGDATILVVDDEENVRQYAEKMLKKLGHKILLAKDGKEAVKIYKQKKDEIDLVLLDMIMPKMDGKETNLALREINPDVKILLASGYSQNGTATEILNEGVLRFIQKPFRMDELSKAIAVALKQ